jgi:ASC-1-like (ASCH) protein
MEKINTILVHEPWFTLIKQGNKTIEGRANKLSRYENYLGHPLILITHNNDQCKVMVKAIRHYSNLDEYIENEGWEKTAPQTGSNQNAKNAYSKILTIKGYQVF